MPKTITISDSKIIEFLISRDEKDEFVLQIVYSLIDDTGQVFAPRRTTLKDLDLTAEQKQAIQKVWDLMLNTSKSVEKI